MYARTSAPRLLPKIEPATTSLKNQPLSLPDAVAAAFSFNFLDPGIVRQQLFRARSQNQQRRTHGRLQTPGVSGLPRPRRFIKSQGYLTTRHRQIDVRQDLGIEERPVQAAAGVVDVVALAKGIKAVFLPGMQTAC